MHFPVIADRELYIVGMGIDRLKIDGSIIIMARTIDKDKDFQEECGVNVPEPSKLVRVDIPFFTF